MFKGRLQPPSPALQSSALHPGTRHTEINAQYCFWRSSLNLSLVRGQKEKRNGKKKKKGADCTTNHLEKKNKCLKGVNIFKLALKKKQENLFFLSHSFFHSVHFLLQNKITDII